jgi:hypothetical protein
VALISNAISFSAVIRFSPHQLTEPLQRCTQVAAEQERKQNAHDIQRSYGSNVVYGQLVQVLYCTLHAGSVFYR